MTAPISRLVSLGTVVIDVVMNIAHLPERGADIIASGAWLEPGGAFNVMVAARRQGLRTACAGTTGTGPFGDLARAALDREGIDLLHRPVLGVDTGFDVAMVDAEGERTFVTAAGAEGQLTVDCLDRVELAPTDAVYVSGYSLLHPMNRAAILDRLPRLAAESTVVFDPGPLGHEIPAGDLDVISARADWWSCNEREAALSTGLAGPVDAASALMTRLTRGTVLLRLGAGGCVVVGARSAPRFVSGFPVEAIDTNGAGDVHVGAFIAGLAAGLDPARAAARSNAAAAIAVTRAGPSAAPTSGEVDEFLRGQA